MCPEGSIIIKFRKSICLLTVLGHYQKLWTLPKRYASAKMVFVYIQPMSLVSVGHCCGSDFLFVLYLSWEETSQRFPSTKKRFQRRTSNGLGDSPRDAQPYTFPLFILSTVVLGKGL